MNTGGTRPLPNVSSKFVNALGKLIPPWNLWLSQKTQAQPAPQPFVPSVSPYSVIINDSGHAYILGGAVSNISLIRGGVTINLTGQVIIPISIADTLEVTYSVIPTILFLAASI